MFLSASEAKVASYWVNPYIWLEVILTEILCLSPSHLNICLRVFQVLIVVFVQVLCLSVAPLPRVIGHCLNFASSGNLFDGSGRRREQAKIPRAYFTANHSASVKFLQKRKILLNVQHWNFGSSGRSEQMLHTRLLHPVLMC